MKFLLFLVLFLCSCDPSDETRANVVKDYDPSVSKIVNVDGSFVFTENGLNEVNLYCFYSTYGDELAGVSVNKKYCSTSKIERVFGTQK